MKRYTFHEGPLPPDIKTDLEPALFNLSDFRMMQDSRRWMSFYIVNEKSRKVAACLHVHLDGDKARSPYRAPFGSVECDQHIPPSVLFDFLGFVDLRLKDEGVKEVLIKNSPRAYAPEFLSLLETVLLNHGYVISDAEIGAVLSIDETTFVSRIRHAEMLRHHQAVRAGLVCRQLDEGNAREVYNFIATCHARKGYPVSMSCDILEESVRMFPGRYILFGIFRGDQMLAASVSIIVRKDVLYNFLVNHEATYNSLSPPLLLMEALYNYCSDNGMRLLDLGTSALDGKPNFSLLDFKLHVGGIPTTKFSFHKRLL